MSKMLPTRRMLMVGFAAIVTAVAVPVAYAKEVMKRFKLSDAAFEGKKAIVTNPQLADEVKKNKAAAVKALSADIGPLKVSEVSLDKDGKVVIANEKAAAKLKSLSQMTARGSGFFDNCSCT
jgi:hypothetical protein